MGEWKFAQSDKLGLSICWFVDNKCFLFRKTKPDITKIQHWLRRLLAIKINTLEPACKVHVKSPMKIDHKSGLNVYPGYWLLLEYMIGTTQKLTLYAKRPYICGPYKWARVYGSCSILLVQHFEQHNNICKFYISCGNHDLNFFSNYHISCNHWIPLSKMGIALSDLSRLSSVQT